MLQDCSEKAQARPARNTRAWHIRLKLHELGKMHAGIRHTKNVRRLEIHERLKNHGLGMISTPKSAIIRLDILKCWILATD